MTGVSGSGKSSFTMVIRYALFGDVQKIGRLSKTSVVNKQAKGDCFVKLYFVKDGTSYRIERYRNHSVEKNGLKIFSRILNGSDGPPVYHLFSISLKTTRELLFQRGRPFAGTLMH